MHEIPPHLEQMLREQGLDDAHIDELRRTGHLEGDDGAGNTFAVDVEAGHGASMRVNGVAFDASEVVLPPDALRMIQRFRRFIPREAMESLELSTGQDIDGDGHIGRRPETASVDAARPHKTASPGSGRSSAMPGGHVSGDPFVTPSAGRRVGGWLLALLLIGGAVAVWLMLR